jgi:hypothetical protein
MKNKIVQTEKVKYKIVKRILKYSKIYSPEYLGTLSLKELVDIQEKCFIRLLIKNAFRFRHQKN